MRINLAEDPNITVFTPTLLLCYPCALGLCLLERWLTGTRMDSILRSVQFTCILPPSLQMVITI